MYYIYTDHLNTPRAITDIANNLQWTWENKEAFGNNSPTEVVTGFKFNFRLPGQYFDSETNLNYNIHRDYNPVWGRYMSSDPLGLAAGVNTYGYVSGNGLGNSDKNGLIAPALIPIIPMILGAGINATNVHSAGGDKVDIAVGTVIGAVAGNAIGRIGSLGYGFWVSSSLYGGVGVTQGLFNRTFANTKSLNNFAGDISVNFIGGAVGGGICSIVGGVMGVPTRRILADGAETIMLNQQLGTKIGGELGSLNGGLIMNNTINYLGYSKALPKSTMRKLDGE